MYEVDQPSLVPIPFHTDVRGVFSKPFSDASQGRATFAIAELFWTNSSKGCVRGMHFQTPPAKGNKLVWVSHGSLVDVVVDVRKHAGYGEVTSFELNETTASAVWVPVGFAHGFQALEDDTIINYAVDSAYSPGHDAGVLWDSIEFDWPLRVGAMSERDQAFPSLKTFQSPFEVDA